MQYVFSYNIVSQFVSVIRGPTSGDRGTVLLPFEGNPLSKIGVKFDKPVPNGVNFAGFCDSGHGYFCNGKSAFSLNSFYM